jgi:hypothetical protein
MKRLLVLGVLLILSGTLASCGVLDLTGSNARAQAQAEAWAASSQAQATQAMAWAQAQIAHDQTLQQQNYFAYLLSLVALKTGQAETPSAGTDHQGGITGALSVGMGIGWPIVALIFLAVLMALTVLWLIGRMSRRES